MKPSKEAQILEALLFSAKESLTTSQMAKVIGAANPRPLHQTIEELNRFYQRHQRAFFIEKNAGGYLMKTKPEFKPWITKSKVVKTVQFSKSVLETLAIVAYLQPVTRAEIEDIRAVDASYAVRTLLDRGLLRITGRKDIPGRPMLYGTSKRFLDVFGFNKLSELPRPEDFELTIDQSAEVTIEEQLVKRNEEETTDTRKSRDQCSDSTE